MSEIACRALGPNDFALLVDSPLDLFDYPVLPDAARAFLERDGHLLVVAIAAGGGSGRDGAGRIVGFVSAVEILHPDQARPELWINEVGVVEAYRRRGIGQALMAETLRVARARGCRAAWVAVDEDNEAALALYQKAGGASPERQFHVDFGYAGTPPATQPDLDDE